MFSLAKIRHWAQPALHKNDLVTVAPRNSADYPLVDIRDIAMAAGAVAALDEQLHALINQNADGVNNAALKIRRETDMLLSYGISDPMAAKAGTLAQVALELANAGRGMNLRNESQDLTPHERVQVVAKSMVAVMRAEMLLKHAKDHNRADIDKALTRQSKVMLGNRKSSQTNIRSIGKAS